MAGGAGMRIMGIDLAGLEKNDTGICIYDGEGKNAIVKVVHTDDEIITEVDRANPSLICIDAPLTMPEGGAMRKCDTALRAYGALPPLMGGMRYLTERGVKLYKVLAPKYRITEVFTTATAKILGFYSTEPLKRQKALLERGIGGDVQKRKLNKDEIDAVVAAITGQLYVDGKAREVGGDDGKIVIPMV
jgi:predicted nuclease with RNAse H fold